MRISTLRSALSCLGVALVLVAGAAPGLARCAPGPHQPAADMAAMDSHAGMAGSDAPAPPPSLPAWSSGVGGAPDGAGCCLAMSSCAPPGLVIAHAVRIGSGGPPLLTHARVSLDPESSRPAPESPPPKA